MKYKKVMLVSKDEISSWESCRHITNNLGESYKRAFRDADILTLKVAEDLTLMTAFLYAKQIRESGCDLLIWLDHKPNASLMVEALNMVFLDVEFILKPKFIIHLFGDFVLDCLGWEGAEEALKNYPVHFIAASNRQKKIIDSFFSGHAFNCSVIPFPVNADFFNTKDLLKNRKEQRSIFDATNDLIVLYTGRISYQKNVDTVVKIFKNLQNHAGRKVQLWIAGPWDDILIPYAGMMGVPGSYYSQFMSSVSNELGENVKFMGQLKPQELIKLYHASDLYMSLSTYNDEDYGMSVAEALATGLPCLLSDWGGFSSFANYSSSIDLVEVTLGPSGPVVNAVEAKKSLLKMMLKHEFEEEKRHAMSQDALEHLSIDSCAKKIYALLSDLKFSSLEKYSPLFYKMCVHFKINPNAPFKGRSANLSEFYKEIYKNYVS